MRKIEKEFIKLLRECNVDIGEVLYILEEFYTDLYEYYKNKNSESYALIFKNIVEKIKNFKSQFNL